MNRLTGTIVFIESAEGVVLVRVKIYEENLTALMLSTAESERKFWIGGQVDVVFKETEVSLARGPLPALSIRNRLPCAIHSLDRGKVLARLRLDYRGHRLNSVITARAADELELAPGLGVTALIKSTEVNLAETQA